MRTEHQKLKSLIAFIAASRPRLGKVRLFKLLYLIDFSAYARLGHSVTGEIYENFEMGPVPRTLWKHFDGITRDCVTVEAVGTPWGIPEQQMTARPDFVPQLTVDEAGIANEILAQYGDYAGTSLKELTHEQVPYLATSRGDAIPYGLAGYLFFKRPSASEIASVRNDAPLMERVRAAVVRSRGASAP